VTVELPRVITSDLRFSARVDYFETAEGALRFALYRRAEGFNVNGGARLVEPKPSQREGFVGLYPVHWIDRKGEGWFG